MAKDLCAANSVVCWILKPCLTQILGLYLALSASLFCKVVKHIINFKAVAVSHTMGQYNWDLIKSLWHRCFSELKGLKGSHQSALGLSKDFPLASANIQPGPNFYIYYYIIMGYLERKRKDLFLRIIPSPLNYFWKLRVWLLTCKYLMITLWLELLWVYVGLLTLALPSNLFPRWATKVIWKKENSV